MIGLNEDRTTEVVQRIQTLLDAQAPYEAIKQITADFLGARKLADDQVLFGFWVPGLVDGALQGRAEQIRLELFTPPPNLNFRALQAGQAVEVTFAYAEVQLAAVDDFMVGVVDGVQIGTGTRAGAFYWLRYDAADGTHFLRDPLVASCPFGVYAPGEVFDVAGMLAARQDMDYFRSWHKTIFPDGTYRARDVGVHVEIHPETATAAGTIEALTARYQAIAAKMQGNLDAGRDLYADLSPADMNFVAFDSIELTPEVPTAERESISRESGEFFRPAAVQGREVQVRLKRPDISNWGYDTPILGSAAVSPSILGSLRPNEFLAFIETIHTMPGRPIQLCLDSVLGHCDFQGARLLTTFDQPSADYHDPLTVNSKYLKGPNMYGRDIDFSEPHVKAILLELLVRKLNLGYDCIRVDGAQDFIIRTDPETGLRIQDDEFLNEMSNVVQDINGLRRRLDVNLEDGRPWPDDLNWLYNSKYLDHCIERTLPFGDRVKQWSPIIFAHNVHGKYKWFMEKWDRFVEVFRYGENWITGHSNHDNARYFYRLVKQHPARTHQPGDDFAEFYNDQLGDTLPEVAHNALDHNGLTALSLGFLPGNPMFLLNALFRTPWLFFRNIDDVYAVKLVADEGSRFLDWYIDARLYAQPTHFQRLKQEFGFAEYRQLVAPPVQKAAAPAFMDMLFQLGQRVRTEALMARFLFDDPEDAGGYETLAALQAAARIHAAPLGEDELGLQQRVPAARALFQKSERFLRRDLVGAPPAQQAVLEAQLARLAFLETLDDATVARLLEDANRRDAYDVAVWAENPTLVAAAPSAMLTAGRLLPQRLQDFAHAFMLDARDVSRVHHYEDAVSPLQAAFNLRLRRYRQANPWLLRNPSNDVRLDYFARKLFINGAKDLGDWGDRGDVINANTIYYGWRTDPEQQKQVFLITNMEGKPIERCHLRLFMNQDGLWNVVAASPSMGTLPPQLDRSYVIDDFKNGEALLLERNPE